MLNGLKYSSWLNICFHGILGVIAREETSNTLDVESVGSDTNFPAVKERNEGSFGRKTDRERNSATIQGEETLDLKAGKPGSDEHLSREIMAKEIQCNVITDSGLVKNVEIYDYDKRGTCLLIFIKK